MRNASEDSRDKFLEYPVWWANYIRQRPLVGPEDQLRNWQKWDVWQYTGWGACPGVKGNVDLNWMAGNQLCSLLVP